MVVKRRKDSKNRILKPGEYQRSKNSYEYKWRDKRGKRHSINAKSLEELREKELDILRNTLDGIKQESSDITINDLYNTWISLKRGVKDNTFQNYKYMYTQFVEPDFGNIKIKDLKRSDVRAFYNSLIDERHLRVNTIDCVHTVLYQTLQLGVEDDYIRYNPADNALRELKKIHSNDSRKREALTIQQQNIFEKYLEKQGKDHRWYPVFITMLYTGLRVGELTGLRWQDIDFELETINVNHTLIYYDRGKERGCGFAINTPKTKAGLRTIPMTQKVKEAFILEKKFQEEAEIKCNAVVDGYTDFIFINRFGGVQHQGTLNKALKRIIRDCNYEILDNCKEDKEELLLHKFSNHTLRHTFATRMCEAGVNLKAMQDILGHADVETSMNIYVDAKNDLKVTEMTKFEDYCSNENK